MRYDDRLATVLRLTPVGPNVARIQFRQLLDLLGTTPAQDQGAAQDEAYLRLSDLSAKIPASARATILREGTHRLRSPRLIATLAGAELVVARAAIETAQLAPDQWLDLIPALPVASRGLLQARNDLSPEARTLLARLGIGRTALPSPPQQAAPQQATPAPNTIGALVRRIEAFRLARQNTPSPAPAPLPESPPAPIHTSFDFASDGDGRIVWSESAVAPMVVGTALARGATASAVRLHQPLRAAPITLDGAPAIAGAWQVDAVPRFDPQGGRYIGHIGRFRRPAPPLTPSPHLESEADRLRQLLHELRTPVNAIQGFAEIIQQQLFGPAPHEYRALAAAVAGDSAQILAGFEELERYARLDSGDLDLTSGESDLATCLAAQIAQLQPGQTKPGPRLHLDAPASLPLSMPAEDAERLCWRLLAVIAGNAQDGEALTITLSADPTPTLRLPLPAALAGLPDAALYHASARIDSAAPRAGMFGTGFSLRLAAAEARAAGGALLRDGAALVLTLPAPRPTPPLASRATS